MSKNHAANSLRLVLNYLASPAKALQWHPHTCTSLQWTVTQSRRLEKLGLVKWLESDVAQRGVPTSHKSKLTQPMNELRWILNFIENPSLAGDLDGHSGATY